MRTVKANQIATMQDILR
jgi:hypothetical protein